MKKIYCILFTGILLLSACTKEAITPENQYLEETQQAGVASKTFLEMALRSVGYGVYADLLRSDVKMLKVNYNTKYKGNKLVASGVFLVSENFNPQYPTVIYTHGTIDENSAPSLAVANMQRYTDELILCAVLASSFNCAVLMPDYIGYGVSAATTHPYIHAPSLGQASFDFIQAFKEYAATPESKLSFNNNIFITGYSEGGYAAVALQKKIQETTASGFKIEKVIAGSGPYDNVAFIKECLKLTTNLDAKFISSYLWTLGMYKNDYAYSKNYNAIFSAADNSLLQSKGYDLAYFHTMQLPINTNMSLLLKPEFIDAVLQGSDTEFLNMIAENSFTNFVPSDSLILVYGTADNWVFPINSINTYDAMSVKGGKVISYAFENGNHETTQPYYLNILLSRLQILEFI